MEQSGAIPGGRALLAEAWGLYRSKLKFFLQVLLIPALSFAAGAVVASGFVAQIEAGNWIFVLPLVLAGVLMAVVHLWGQVTLIDHLDAPPASIRDAYAASLPKVRNYFWVSILGGFIVLAGVAALVVPGILFALWFCFASFVAVREGEKGLKALLRSKYYVQGNAWTIAKRFLFFGLLTLLIYLLLGALAGDRPFWNFLSELAVSFVWMPLGVAYSFALYRHAKSGKEGATVEPTRREKLAIAGVALFGLLLLPIILVALFAFGFDSTAKVRDHIRTADLQRLRTGLELYYSQYQRYPDSLAELSGTLERVPQDPRTGSGYEYRPSGDRMDYELCVDFEAKPDECRNSIFEREAEGSGSI